VGSVNPGTLTDARSLDDCQMEAAMAMATVGLGQAAQAIRHAERAVELLPVSKDATEGPFYVYLTGPDSRADRGSHRGVCHTRQNVQRPGFYNEIWVQRDPGFAAHSVHTLRFAPMSIDGHHREAMRS
jgi:hypothetical protein